MVGTNAWIVDGRPDPKKFPDPQQFATWISNRPDKFKTHTTLGQCKNAISGKATHQGVRTLQCDAWVYEFDADLGWVEVHHLPRGTVLDHHEFYKTKTNGKAKTIEPSEASIDAAIASIARSAQAQEEA